jgi:hypothetical protein
VEYLKLQDESTHFERSYTREAAVVTALLYLCNNSGQDFALMGAVAAEANKQMVCRGERARLTPKAVGAIVHRLGFITERIGSIGRGIWMNQGVKQTTFNLARYHGVLQLESPARRVYGVQADSVENKRVASEPQRNGHSRKGKQRKSRVRNKRRNLG